MMNSLNTRAFRGLFILAAVMAGLLFVTAGTIDFWQAWLFLAVYFTASLVLTLYLMRNDPQLLDRRMRGGPAAEKEWRQRVIMSFASLGFLGLLIVPALDRRFGWSHIPAYGVLVGEALIIVGWLATFFVFRENTFTSATIELAPDQRVVTTGPYAIVRHPMYAGALIMLSGIPIALGSWWGLLVIAALMPVLIWRLLDEERFLARNLVGYAEYQQHVRYRLIPLIW